MPFSNNLVHKTYYDILGVKENASFEEIRTCYRSAILNSHPDKLQKASETSNPNYELGDRYFEVRRAWDILGNSKSRAIYDSELQALRQDVVTAENVSLEELTVEDSGEVIELLYPCSCGDYFLIDSLELGEMGYPLLRDESKISLKMSNASPASVILPCGSCSLKVCLLINADTTLRTDDHL